MADVQAIYRHYGVKLRPRSGKKEGPKLQPQRRGEKSRDYKWRLYKEHQRLFSLGAKVLLEELVAGSGGLGPVSLVDIHKTFDPIFADPSPSVGPMGVRPGSLPPDAPLFSEDEVARDLQLAHKGSAPGPDGLTVPELSKVPPGILALIYNNWLSHGYLPNELRASRTVFIPKKPDATSASELCPITLSSLLVRLYSRLLLIRLQQSYSFHPLQGGFSPDRAAHLNLLLLQGLMGHAKRHKRPFYAAALDLKKA